MSEAAHATTPHTAPAAHPEAVAAVDHHHDQSESAEKSSLNRLLDKIGDEIRKKLYNIFDIPLANDNGHDAHGHGHDAHGAHEAHAPADATPANKPAESHETVSELKLTVSGPCKNLSKNPKYRYVGLGKKQRMKLGIGAEAKGTVELFDSAGKSLGIFKVGKGARENNNSLDKFTANGIDANTTVTVKKSSAPDSDALIKKDAAPVSTALPKAKPANDVTTAKNDEDDEEDEDEDDDDKEDTTNTGSVNVSKAA